MVPRARAGEGANAHIVKEERHRRAKSGRNEARIILELKAEIKIAQFVRFALEKSFVRLARPQWNGARFIVVETEGK